MKKSFQTKAWLAWLLALGALLLVPHAADAIIVIPMTPRVSLDATCGNADDANPMTLEKGTPIYLCYGVTNAIPTQETLFNVKIQDALVPSITPASAVIPLTQTVHFRSTNPIIANTSQVHQMRVSGSKAGGAEAFLRGPNYITYYVFESKLSIATTVSTDGTCPGQEIVNVLPNDDITWCYTVTNTGTATIKNISITDDIYGGVPGAIPTLAPGESYTLSRADLSSIDMVLTAHANGQSVQTGVNVVSNYDPAAVNVVNPDIDIDVTVSVDGICPGVDSATVPAGTNVNYCYLVTNNGTESLVNVTVTDANNNVLFTIPSLSVGGSQLYAGAPLVADADGSETATASGTDIYGFPVADTDSALLHVLYANLVIQKTGPSQLNYVPGGTPIQYSITVTNTGDAVALSPIVTDALPLGSSFVSALSTSGSCSFSSLVTCALGDLGPGESATIILDTLSVVPSCSVTNTAVVDNNTLETNYADNASSATTQIIPVGGSTRTYSFYANHPSLVSQCLAANAGSINLGFITVQDESADDQIDVDGDNTAETGLALAMGVLNANYTKYKTNAVRPFVQRERMKAARHLLAAICNSTLLGTPAPFDIPAAINTLSGSDAVAISQVGHYANAYNNIGVAVTLPVDPGAIDNNFAWDDPTDGAD